jgi:2-methylisocitrate lyase-like PEP mutase family enzyme
VEPPAHVSVTYRQRPGDLAEPPRGVRRFADAGARRRVRARPAEPGDVAAVVAAVEVPVNVPFLPGRHTVRSLTDLGVRRVSTGSLLSRAALAASVETAVAVREGAPVRTDLPPYAELSG